MNIHDDGIDIKEGLVSYPIIESIKKEVLCAGEMLPKHGIRNADKKFHSISALANSYTLVSLATTILGSKPSIVRSIFFDKTPDTNWLVAWHQDKTIALNKKVSIAGWGPWTLKDKVHHVQPPLSVLEQMITFRIHLDDADERNGCLKVITRSHQLGILPQGAIASITQVQKPFICKVKAGDTVIMRPHILHSSPKSAQPNHRRVIHIEYSNFELPHGLMWA